ncbi:DUF2306 domain-containing protein [Salinarimonas chemoclinalis]|uniref:DUF2306 domain-containing protein n=1 Tax=Salinarimonas chemoclinalis TaxID=3241599 RepID=UPI0035571D3F
MSLAPLLAAPTLVQVHAFAAIAALLLGVFQLRRPKGGGGHRLVGWIWVSLMLIVAISSFGFVYDPLIAGFSWIHGLSAFTVVMVTMGVVEARRQRVAAHRTTMIMLFWFALVLTGAFTLLPGRIMHAVVFGG